MIWGDVERCQMSVEEIARGVKQCEGNKEHWVTLRKWYGIIIDLGSHNSIMKIMQNLYVSHIDIVHWEHIWHTHS